MTETAVAGPAEIWSYSASDASDAIPTRFVNAIEAKLYPLLQFRLMGPRGAPLGRRSRKMTVSLPRRLEVFLTRLHLVAQPAIQTLRIHQRAQPPLLEAVKASRAFLGDHSAFLLRDGFG